MYDKLKEEERHILDVDFGDSPDRLKRKYLDIYPGVHVEVLHSTKFDESSD